MTSLLVTSSIAAMTSSNDDTNSTLAAAEHVFARHSWPSFLAVHSPLALYVDRTLTPIWYLIGLTGNILSAKIWSERRMRMNNSSAIYLVALSITDLLFLLLHSLQELKYAWWVRTLEYPVICEGYFFLVLVVQYVSPILVFAFTVERYIAVCRPFVKERYCTGSLAVKVIVCLVSGCAALCSIQAYFWTYNASVRECQIRVEVTIGGTTSIWSIWSWITEMFIFFLVPLVILIFNMLVILEIRRLSRSEVGLIAHQQHVIATKTGSRLSSIGGAASGGGGGNGASTVLLLSVSFYVIVTTLPATLVYVLHSQFPEGDVYMSDESIAKDAVWRRYLAYMTARKVVEEICLSHYACNIFLYLITGAQFRKSFRAMFRKTSGSSWALNSEQRSGGERTYKKYLTINGNNIVCKTPSASV